MRRFFSKLSIFGRKANKAAISENVEKNLIDTIIRDIGILENATTKKHPLQSVASSIKPKIDAENLPLSFAVVQDMIGKELDVFINKIDKTLPVDEPSLLDSISPVLNDSDSSRNQVVLSEGGVASKMLGKLTLEQQHHKEAVFRLTFGRLYFKALEEIINIYPELTKDQASRNLKSLVDCILLGTSSERVQEHMKLFGNEMDQEIIQACYYPLYEAEIETANILMKMYPISLERHEKKIKKLTNGYLLDTLELNTKIRCIMAWSDPNHGKGFAPVADDVKLPIDILLKGRKEFFKEGETMGRTYLTAVRGIINTYYETKKDNRELLRNGVIFFIGTCIADYIVCTI